MKKLSILSLLLVASIFAFGQNVPQKINYQAVAHDASGGVLANQPLNVTIGVLSGSATGTLVYEETHNVSTNEHGLFYLKIGEGSVNLGAMNAISWGGADHFLNVNVNGDDLGTTQLVSVPYALLSKNTNGINGNGISNITVNDGDILVFNGTSGQWESQPNSGTETTTTVVDNGDGTFTYTNELGTPITFDANIDDADADPINEIQDLQLIGDSLFITNNVSATAIDLGPYRDLPLSAATGDILTWNGSAWVAGVDQVDDLDNDPSNENIVSFTTNVTKDSLFLQDAGGVYAVGLNSGELSRINDADNNTYVETELGVNDDVIRFGQGGTEYFNMSNGHLNVENTGGSVFLGFDAGLNDIMSFTDNVFIGNIAGTSNTTGNKNVAVGAESSEANTVAYGNTAVGYQSLKNNTTGDQNAAFGQGALVNNVSGIQNSAFGAGSLSANTIGTANIAVGLNALSLNTDGGSNTAIGYSSMTGNVNGNSNTTIGFGSDVGLSNLSNATAIGANAIVDIDNAMVLGNGVNVGIGTSAPSNKLEVVGDAAKFDSVIIVNGANAGYVLTSDASGSASWQVPTTPATFWSGSLGNVYPTTLTDNVGIGTTTPVSELDVMGNARLNDGKLMLGPVGGVNSGYTGVYEDGGDLKLAVFAGGAPTTNFGTNSIDALTIKSNSAYVGIGTTNPLANLNVVGADPGHMAKFENSNNAGSSSMIFADDTGSDQLYLGFANTGYSSLWNGHGYLNTVQDFIFAKNNGERMRLGAGGFGIGTNAPDATLDVVGNFQLQDGTEAAGSVLTSDASGNASWQSNSSWSIDGNSGTIDGVNFIGTIDNVPLGFRVNNSNAGKIDVTLRNTSLGGLAGNTLSTGQSNTAIGDWALRQTSSGTNNTAIGVESMFNNTTGSNNTAIGAYSGTASGNLFNTTAIGYNVLVSQSNSVVLGNNANVGIGTTAPTAKLDVIGAVKITDGTEGLGKVLTSDAAGNASWQDANAKIAFYAGNNATNLPAGDTIPGGGGWTTMIFGDGGSASYLYFNEGGAYSLATGQFNAPVPGVYQLSTNLDLRGTPGTQVIVNLRSATTFMGQQMVTLDANGKGSVSMSATVRSDKGGGGISWVELASFGPYVVVDPYYSSFSGHLVYKL